MFGCLWFHSITIHLITKKVPMGYNLIIMIIIKKAKKKKIGKKHYNLNISRENKK